MNRMLKVISKAFKFKLWLDHSKTFKVFVHSRIQSFVVYRKSSWSCSRPIHQTITTTVCKMSFVWHSNFFFYPSCDGIHFPKINQLLFILSTNYIPIHSRDHQDLLWQKGGGHFWSYFFTFKLSYCLFTEKKLGLQMLGYFLNFWIDCFLFL